MEVFKPHTQTYTPSLSIFYFYRLWIGTHWGEINFNAYWWSYQITWIFLQTDTILHFNRMALPWIGCFVPIITVANTSTCDWHLNRVFIIKVSIIYLYGDYPDRGQVITHHVKVNIIMIYLILLSGVRTKQPQLGIALLKKNQGHITHNKNQTSTTVYINHR